MREATHCYVATREGQDGAYAFCVDDPQFPRHTAQFVRDVFEEGGRIERVPCDAVSGLLKEWLTWKKRSEPMTGELPL